MKRNPNKRAVREDEEAQPSTRRRLKDNEEMEREARDAALREAEANEADTSSDWEDDDMEGVALDEVIDDDDDDSVIDDDDDAEYADLRDEGAGGALASGLKSVTFAADVAGGAEEEDDAEEVMVWRNDQQPLEGDTQLEYSNKAYDSFFQLRTEYPCLSFDVVKDKDGANRTTYPLTTMLVCGSQAEQSSENHLIVLRISNICRTKHDALSDDDSEDSYIGDEGDSEDGADEEDEEEINDGEPVVHHRSIAHYGTANRVRCSPHNNPASGSQLVAVWSDAGHVQIIDVEGDAHALADFANWSKEQALKWKDGKPSKQQHLKFCTPSSSHKTEGYGLDWSTITPHVFASGDCNGSLFVWQPSDDGRWKASSSNTDGGASIEEIQWSPTQAEVLISTRAGGIVQVWDTRDMRQPKVQWQADPTDINVASWNRARQASHLLVTGAESGAVAVWDLRKLASKEPIQQMPWHTKSITSVEFSLHNESVLSVTGDDGQCTLWDLSLERDPSEEQEVIGELFGRPDLTGIPDQLMFQHQGLKHPKEAHWHSQIPGMVITTDYEGLHLFRPMNWRSLMK